MAINKAQAINELKAGAFLVETIGLRYGRIYSIGNERVNGNVFNGLKKRGEIKELEYNYYNGSLRSVTYAWNGQTVAKAVEAETVQRPFKKAVQTAEPKQSKVYETVTVVQSAASVIAIEAPNAEAIESLRKSFRQVIENTRTARGWSLEVEASLNDAILDLMDQIVNEAQIKLEAMEE